LTQNQPASYLKLLPKQVKSVLLFVAPAMRFVTLWAKLLTESKRCGVFLKPMDQSSSVLKVGQINENQCLALASWRSVLSFILTALETEGQTEVASDVKQLQSVCENMDDTAMLPIRSEEITSNIGTRVTQYCQLVDEVASQLLSENWVSSEKLKVGHGFDRRAQGLIYYSPMFIHGFGCCLQFSSGLWGSKRETPLWLSVQGRNWRYSQSAKECLSKLELEEPSRLLDLKTALFIPLDLPVGAEKHEVAEALGAQIREVAGYLKSGTP